MMPWAQIGHRPETRRACEKRKPLCLLARPAGFEPTTPWFVAKYSIQLSYGRIKSERIIAKTDG